MNNEIKIYCEDPSKNIFYPLKISKDYYEHLGYYEYLIVDCKNLESIPERFRELKILYY